MSEDELAGEWDELARYWQQKHEAQERAIEDAKRGG